MTNQEWYCTNTVIAHDCIYYFFLRRAQDANWVFHQSGSDAVILYDTILARALDKVVTLSGEVLSERNHPPDIKTSWRRLLATEKTCVHVKSTRSTTYTRREGGKTVLFFFPLDETSLLETN